MKVKILLSQTLLTLLLFSVAIFNCNSQCTAPTYSAGTPYNTGQQVQNGGKLYRCDVGGWCSSTAGWAYAPGSGSAWTTAWTEVGNCSGTTPTLTTITISPSSSSVTNGSTRQFSATGKDQNGNAITIKPTWTVSGGGSISSTGLFTASAVGGPFTVTATQGTVRGTATVTVTNTISTPVLSTITVSPSPASVAKGSTRQFSATGRDQSGNTMSITPTWTVSGGGTISSSGLFTASTAGGPFTVTATQGTIKGTASVSVTETSSCTVPAWNSNTVYSAPGNMVSYNGKKYSNLWWTQNEAPGTSSVWKDEGSCGGGTTTNQSPTVSFTAPSSTVNQTTLSPITISATASDPDGTIASVVFSVEGRSLTPTASGSTYSTSGWTPSAFGTYTISVAVKDNAGATVTKTMSVTVNKTTVTDPGGGDFILSEAQYNEIFPYRFGTDANTGVRDPSKDFFSYANFKEAVNRMRQIEALFERRKGTNYYKITQKNKTTGKTTVIRTDAGFNTSSAAIISSTVDYGTFANEGTTVQKKRELAAFLANIAQETTGGWDTAPGGRYAWGLYFREEVGFENGQMIGYRVDDALYPPAPGKSYHGRGPIQLSYNYNYGQVSAFLYADKNVLLSNPEKVTQDGALAFQTGIWFWMTPQWPKPSAHDVMVGKWNPSSYDSQRGRKAGFGMTVNIINGGIECGSGSEFVKVTHRIGHYKRFLGILGASGDLDGTNDCSECGCANQRPYGLEVEPDAGTFARLDPFYNNLSEKNKARIFPNPGNGVVNIELNLVNSSNVKVNLINSMGNNIGKLVDENDKAGINMHSAALNHLPSGIYFIEVVTETNTERLPLIIK